SVSTSSPGRVSASASPAARRQRASPRTMSCSAPATGSNEAPMYKTLTIIAVVLLAAGGRSRMRAAGDDAVVFVGAGDIANCEILGGARATASLLDQIDGAIFTLGDHA